MTYISAMELTTLLNKTKVSVTNLTIYEHRFLSFLLARVNGKKVPFVGYLAWPGVDEIQDYTAISTTQIGRIRKTLVQAGWMQYIPGKGPKNSNHYYINAQKIVDCAMMSGENSPKNSVAPTVMEDKAKEPHKRNTTGLVQNRAKVLPVVDADPFNEVVKPVARVEVSHKRTNADGSPLFFTNGKPRSSWDDSMESIEDSDECPF